MSFNVVYIKKSKNSTIQSRGKMNLLPFFFSSLSYKIFVTIKSNAYAYALHLIKVLLPSQLAHLGTLQLHVLSTGSLSVGLDLALDRGVERAQDAGSEEGSVDAVVDANGCDGDT
jgi:hypothetical protein